MDLEELRDALIASGSNKAEQVILLITACIEGEINTGSEIVSAVSDLGFDKRYVGKQLSTNAGSNAEGYHWYRDADGDYRLLN